MAQPAQHTGGNKKKAGFNWKTLIFPIIILVGIIMLALWKFGVFSHHDKVEDFSKFETDIKAAGTSTTDGDYFESVKVGSGTNKIEVIYHHGTTTSKYVVYGTEKFKNLYGSMSKINGLAVTNGVTTKPQDYFNGPANALHAKNGGDNGTIESLPYPKRKFNWIGLILSFLPMAILIGFMIWIAKKQGMSSGGMMSNKSPAKKVISKTRFTDIAGNEEVKEEVMEVIDFLKNPKKYEAAGAKIPKGILLGGPPGTGKTLVAKATAGEAGVPFYFISASNFVEMFAGLGAKRVRSMFAEARANAPAVLFIDELDAVARKRGSSLSGNDEREQTLNQILVEMDGMDENAGLLILAATNRPDVLDPAILRPGRFDRTITLNNPDIKEREAILKLHAKGKRISSDVSFANVAKRVPGYSGAELASIINEAALLSVREDTKVITLEQIDEAIDRVKAGPAKKNRVISKEELTMVAFHEAGHAVIGLKVASSQEVQKITIIPRGNAGGYNLMTPKKETYNYKKSELLAMIMSFMGGRAAEQIIYGKGEVSTGASNDIQMATNIARSMVTQYGMSELGPIAYEQPQGNQFLGMDRMQKEYSESMSERIDDAVRKLILQAENEAIKTIKKHMKLLELIKDELLERETIVKEQIEYINKNLKRPPAPKKKKVSKEDLDLLSLIKDVNDSKEETKTTPKKKTVKKKVTPKKKTETTKKN